ncbi:MAG: DEAD/DEAH box helicase [Bacteroidota bacterium]|nr:DEAD/DEAH box helicase [Bacteroidota bacterium]
MINEKLDIQLLEVLKENGLTESTELEQICIPKIKSGRDLLCIAPDGSGKTTTIVVSVLQRLKASLDDNPRAIIVVQNKERALEMQAEFARLGEYTDLRVHTACDNEKIADQKDKIYMGSDVVIGTAKRLNQIYTLYALNLGVVKIFAIDNAEQVIKSINYTQIDRLSESMPKAQRVVFATQMNDLIERFASVFMNVQEVIEIEEKEDETESAE